MANLTDNAYVIFKKTTTGSIFNERVILSMGLKNYVIMREICPVCDGRRIIKDPTGFWTRLDKAEAEAAGGRFDELTFYRYMMDHGVDPEDPDTWPVEKETCNVCDANGILEIRTCWDDAAVATEDGDLESHNGMTCVCGAYDDPEIDQELCEC